jgi:hypothetical protein
MRQIGLGAGSFGASTLVSVALLFSSQLALAQFTQQGPKLVGTGVVGNAAQGHSVALSADGNTAIVGGYEDGNDGQNNNNTDKGRDALVELGVQPGDSTLADDHPPLTANGYSLPTV